jgi:proline dehydrogenase
MKEIMNEDIFSSTEIAFENRSDEELKKIYSLFKKMSNLSLSTIGKQMLKASIFLKLPVHKLAEKYLFFHFCGGVNLEDSSSIVENLYKYNVKSVLDYSAECKTSEESFEEIKNEIIKIIDNVSQNREKVPFAVYKMSGIANVELVRKIQNKSELSEEETISKEKLLERINFLSKYAYEKKVPLMVDAEKLDVQGFIDEIIDEMMIKYNKEEAIIFNTIQFYRKDSMDILKNSFKKVTESGAFYGIKTVRGAYYDEEKELAKEKGLESPICDTKEDTDKKYNEALLFCVENIDKVSLFSATHNEYSNKYLIQLMQDYNIDKNDNRIWFSQLYGMSEHITLNIAKLGYNITKYIPYGPLKLVMPYLLRRADENKAIQGQTNREFEIVKKEMRRRGLLK